MPAPAFLNQHSLTSSCPDDPPGACAAAPTTWGTAALRACWRIVLLLLTAWLLAGCVTLHDPEASQEYRSDVVAVVEPGRPVGQTLIARRPSTTALQLWLDPVNREAGGDLLVQIFRSPAETTPLVERSLPVSGLSGQEVTVAFEPLSVPAGQPLFVQLSASGSSVEIFGRSQDAYPYGELWWDGAPRNGDMAFRLDYDYDAGAVLEDLARISRLAWLALPLLITLLLPGWLLLTASGLGRSFDAGSRLALSAGLSMALIPVALAWSTLLGLRWSATGVRLAAVVLLALAVIYLGRRYLWEKAWMQWRPRFSLHGLALAVIFVLALFVRLAMVRDVAAPLWVDSVHHGMIARLILESGGFPESYAPYLDIPTAQYHPGFHSLLAVFVWLSGLDIAWAMLLLGQVINALVVPAAYLFTVALLGPKRSPARGYPLGRTAGLIAALIAGLMTPMPAYYTSWGRYTHLSGVIALPAGLALALALLRLVPSDAAQPPSRRRLVALAVLTGLAAAGLFLIHYRVAAFLVLLLLAWLLAHLPQAIWRRRFGAFLRSDLARLAAAGLMAILFVLPWLPATVLSLFIPKLAWGAVQSPLFGDFSWSYLNTALGRQALVLAGVGLAWAVLNRRLFPWVLALWVALMFVLANLSALGLPGGGFINNTSVTISLFLPIAALGGYVLAWLIEGLGGLLRPHWRPAYTGLVVAAGLWLALVAARYLLPILNINTVLFRQADRPALEWMEAHLPPEETVLVNPFAWGYSIYAGQDGGYWSVPLAGHPSMPPPVLYGWDDDPEGILAINRVIQDVLDHAADPTGLHAVLRQNDINYVYLGVRGGAISPQFLLNNELYRPLYAQDGAYLFEVLP